MGRIIEFEGPTNAKIYIVGAAPNATDELEGKLFSGGAGRLLNRLLMEAGMVRSECRLGSLVRVRSSKLYDDDRKREPSILLQEGIKYLVADIKRVNPNVIVALGNEPLRALTGNYSVINWRGSIVWGKDVNCKVIATFNPADLLRAWSNAPLVMFDFKRIHHESKSPDHQSIPYIFTLAPNFQEVMTHLDRIQTEKVIAFDVETDEDRHITALALAWSATKALCIPFTNSTGAPYWTVEDEDAIWKRIKKLMEDASIKKIAHNAQFDCIIFKLNPHHIDVKGLWMDTMVAFHTVYPEIAASEKEGTTGTMKHKIGGGKKLALLCSLYTRQPYYKFMIKSGDDRKFWTYNCLDAVVTWDCAMKIEREMKEFGVDSFYTKYVHPLLDVLMDMQMRGIRVDNEMRETAVVEYEKDTEHYQSLLDRALGYDVNILSYLQLKELLYNDLGYPPQYKRGSKPPRITADEDALTALNKKYPSPLFELILKVRRNRKILGTYLKGNVGEDGRMRCSYIVGGTETGRLSSRGSIFGSGTNLQNFPHGICRRMLIADKGKVFIAGDLAQAEARVVAYEAEEVRMIKVFEDGEDIHQLSADILPPSFVPRGNEYEGIENPRRLFAKKHVHAFNYGEGRNMFAHRAEIDVTTAKAIRDQYFNRFPSIKAWHLSIQSQLNKCRTMTTALGRRRTFFGLWGESLFREAYAYKPQSTVGDLNNLALVRFNDMRDKCEGAEALLTTHDELVVQCYAKDVANTVAKLREAFRIPVNIKGRTLLIPVEIKTGPNWEDLKKWED